MNEELRPIRIGAVARQPAPDPVDVLYIGLASLLPEHLRALCSCAGVFFGRILSQSENTVELEVAALARYFAGDDATISRHVREMTLSAREFPQLLEYSRELARYAPDDVRAMLEDHVTRTHAGLASLTQKAIADGRISPMRPNRSELKPSAQQKASSSPKNVDADLVHYEPESVIVPLAAIRHLIQVDAGRTARANVDRLLLRAALRYLRDQQETCPNEQHALRTKERRIRRIYQLRGQIPTRKLVEAVPIYSRGKCGEIVSCRVDIDVPVMAA